MPATLKSPLITATINTVGHTVIPSTRFRIRPQNIVRTPWYTDPKVTYNPISSSVALQYAKKANVSV